MLNIHCKYCNYELMPVRDDKPDSFSVVCPNCKKLVTENEVYLKMSKILNPKLENK